MNEAIFGPFFAFCLAPSHLLPQMGRYHGLYACAIDPLDTQANNEIPNIPEKSLFGVQFHEHVFLGKLFCWRTTTADRPGAPWPHHKPKFSNFGNASPKWHSNAEPHEPQFWSGGSTITNILHSPIYYYPYYITITNILLSLIYYNN